MTKRYLFTLIAFSLMLPLTGCCGCRRNSSGSMAPPPAPCCNPAPPPGYVPVGP